LVKIAEPHGRRIQMNGSEILTPVRPVDRAYIKGQFLSPHGNQLVDLVNPTNNKVIGKVTMEPKAIIS
jgi:aldehyde dehydrogenase (NAD+)